MIDLLLIGIGTGHPEHLTLQAIGALIGYAFGELGLHRLEADIDPRNLASARSLEKLGFTREGHLRERWIVGGEVSDSALYGLLAREFKGAPLPA